MQDNELSNTLRSSLEPSRSRKRFLKLVAYGAGSRQLQKGRKITITPPAWQDPKHPLHELFHLELLDASERQQLREQSQWEKNPDFPWPAFAKSLAMEIALPLAIMTMFRLYSPSQTRPNHADRELLKLAYWGDEDSWLALVKLGNQCNWSSRLMRDLLANQDVHSAIAPPIRMLAAPFRWAPSTPPETNRCAPYLNYFYHNYQKTEQFKAWWNKKVTLEPLLKRALEDDAVFQSEIGTSLSRHPRADVFTSALIDHICPRLLCDWLQKYSEDELGFSHQDIANILLLRVEDLQPITQILTILEKQRPGFVRTVTADDGCNLLWLAAPPASHRYLRHTSDPSFPPVPDLLPLYQFLIGKMGVSPYQRNKRGFCFADYDLVARAINQRLDMVGLDSSLPGFDDHKYWAF